MTTGRKTPKQTADRDSKSIWMSAATGAIVGGAAIGLLFGIVSAFEAIASDGPSAIILAVLVVASTFALGAVGGLVVAFLPGVAVAALLDRQGLVRYAPIIGAVVGAAFAAAAYLLWLSLGSSSSAELGASLLIALCGAVGGTAGGLDLRRRSI